MEDRIITIIANTLEIPKESINLKTNLVTDLELESLDFVELVATFEDEFSLEIPDQEIKKIQTVEDIVNIIKSHE